MSLMHLITTLSMWALYLNVFEKSSLDVDGENLLNDTENAGQGVSFQIFTDKEVLDALLTLDKNNLIMWSLVCLSVQLPLLLAQ